jgi:hypothetical protein
VQERRYSPGVPIRFLDHEFPDGSYVGDGEQLVEWTDEVSARLAHEAMLLSQGAERAQEMLNNADPQEQAAGSRAQRRGVDRRRLTA